MTVPESRVRALLDAARSEYEPSPDDQSRVYGALSTTLASGVGADVGPTTASPAPTGAPAGPSLLGATASGVISKVVATTVLVGAVGFGAGYATGRSEAPAPTPASAAATETRPSEPAYPVSPPPVSAVDAGPSVSGSASLPVRPARSPSARAPASPATPSTLWEEAALLREAQRALKANDPKASLRALDRMNERFPAGALQEERMAARVLALCRAGDTDQARTLARRFFARFPRSVHSRRVRSTCEFEKP